MKLKLEKYKQITKLAKANKFNSFEMITNYGLFSGNQNLFKTLTIYNLVKSIKNVKGDIIELGIHKGNTSMLIKKILDIFKIRKKLFLLDHFKGLIHYDPKDPVASRKHLGGCHAKKKHIESFIKFFNFKNIKLIDKDATTLTSGFFGKKKIFICIF